MPPLQLLMVLAEITDSGREFQYSMTCILKLCALVCRRLLGFISFSLWPRVMMDSAREKRMSGLILSIPFRIVYVWIMSPRLRLCTRDGSFSLLILSSYGMSFSSDTAFVARRCTASTSISSFFGLRCPDCDAIL